ncbi:MAG: sulfite exporter TauE/SafE family protein [Candidatus Malihini olakiniferum]
MLRITQLSSSAPCSTWLATLLPTRALAIFFSCFMTYVSLQMTLNIKPKAQRQLSGVTGVSLGGSDHRRYFRTGGDWRALTVPFLTWCNAVQQAIGMSAAVRLPIALARTLGYMINDWSTAGMSEYTLGYVLIPAVVLISAVSFFTVPFGACLAHRLPVATLKKIFAALLGAEPENAANGVYRVSR